MKKSYFFFLLIFCSITSFSQTLIYKSNGNIRNSKNQKLPPNQLRELLKDNEKLLTDYNAGRSKKTAGNVLLIGGPVLIATDLISKVYEKFDFNNPIGRIYPYVLSYMGAAALGVAIPVKIGFSKKIRTVVTEYNNQKATAYNKLKLDLITNTNGFGLRFTLN